VGLGRHEEAKAASKVADTLLNRGSPQADSTAISESIHDPLARNRLNEYFSGGVVSDAVAALGAGADGVRRAAAPSHNGSSSVVRMDGEKREASLEKSETSKQLEVEELREENGNVGCAQGCTEELFIRPGMEFVVNPDLTFSPKPNPKWVLRNQDGKVSLVERGDKSALVFVQSVAIEVSGKDGESGGVVGGGGGDVGGRGVHSQGRGSKGELGGIFADDCEAGDGGDGGDETQNKSCVARGGGRVRGGIKRSAAARVCATGESSGAEQCNTSFHEALLSPGTGGPQDRGCKDAAAKTVSMTGSRIGGQRGGKRQKVVKTGDDWWKDDKLSTVAASVVQETEEMVAGGGDIGERADIRERCNVSVPEEEDARKSLPPPPQQPKMNWDHWRHKTGWQALEKVVTSASTEHLIIDTRDAEAFSLSRVWGGVAVKALESYPDLTGKNVLILNQDGVMGDREDDLVNVLNAKSGRPKTIKRVDGGYNKWLSRYPHLCEGTAHTIPKGHTQAFAGDCEGARHFTTQFTCFTSTKVQILTPEELSCVCRGIGCQG
jgi:hypothetical protein